MGEFEDNEVVEEEEAEVSAEKAKKMLPFSLRDDQKLKIVQAEKDHNKNPNTQFEIKSTYQKYLPSEDLREMKMEERFIKNRQRQMREVLEEKEMLGIAKSFAASKSRLEKEINRKIEANTFASEYSKCSFQSKAQSKRQQDEFE